MPESQQEDSLNEESFSWEKWFRLGLSAFKKTLSRYNFGLPDEFWEHLENAFEELLAAMRIALRTIMNRGRSQGPIVPAQDKTIDIQWDDEEDGDWGDDWSD